MKFTTVFAVLATVATAVSATLLTQRDFLSNGERLAKRLPLNPPARRGTPSHGAHKSKPSASINNSCNTGPTQCCDSVTSSHEDASDLVKGLVGAVIGAGVPVGVNCSPVAGIGSSTSCNQQPVCCENNSFNGIVAIGCSPINIL